jgi:polar amino acid transport system substrate-binding protein
MARNAVLSFTRPYFKIGQMALVRREDRNKHLLGIVAPTGTKGAVIKATTGDFLVQRDFPRVSRKAFANGTEAARALAKGSVDLFITDSTLVWYLAGTRAADGLTAVPIFLSEELLAWGVRRGNDDLLTAANDFIVRADQDGSMKKTFRRWMAVE